MTVAEPGSRVLVDTNVLLAATDVGRAAHADAVHFLDHDPRTLAVTPQILREYVVVATRPVEVNGLGQPVADAVANVRQLLEDVEVVDEDAATGRRLLSLVADGRAGGRQVHDANVVACALVHGAGVVTGDRRHFRRFADLVEIEELSGGSLGPGPNEPPP